MSRDIKQLIQEVLEGGYLMSLATADAGGVWVSDVIYIFDEGLNIYWMSDPDARHSQAILKNPNVAGTITVSSQGEDNLGMQFEGVAERVRGARPDLAVKHRAKRKKPLPEAGQDISEDGEAWDVIKPKRIDLICEKFFGFGKQRLDP